MERNKGACEECERTCQLLHGWKRDLEPMVSRFFKIVIGTDFNEALFLPPKFVENVKELVGQETELEDSRGIRWTVALSYYKDKLAFHKGWDKFSVDKELKVGDLLIFNHIKGGHFVVQAFGTDACEKQNTGIKHRLLKRARTSENKVAENAPYHTSQRKKAKTTDSRAFVQMQPTKINCNPKCEAENREQLFADNDLYMMIDRDAGYVQCDDRTWLYDLSKYENQKNIYSVDMTEECIDGQKVNPDDAQRSVKLKSDWDLNDKCTNEIRVSSMETVITPNTNTVRCNKSEPTCNMSVEHENNHFDDLRNDHPLAASIRHDVIEGDDILNVGVLPQSHQIKDSDSSKCPQNRNRRNSKAKIEMVKNVNFEISEETNGCGQKRASVSATREEDGSSFAASEMSNTVRIVEVSSTNTDLRECLPKVTFPANGEGSMSVTLEDPEGREWAGLYYEHRGLRALLASWDKMKVQNKIEPGDHLAFGAADENVSKKKYKFYIEGKIEMVKNVNVEISEKTNGCGQKRASVSATREEDGSPFAASEMSNTVRIVEVSSTKTNSYKKFLTEFLAKVAFPANGEGSMSVTLEDPEGREWAGLYYEHRGLRALLASWDKMRAQNKIEPGDHLAFGAADEKASKKYKFYIGG